MDIGSELRQARQRAGRSLDDIAQRTKIQQHKLEALENNEFERLPDGIYLDGIVRAYAVEVGLDPGLAVARVRDATAQIKFVDAMPNDVEMFPHEDLDTFDRARADDHPAAAAVAPLPRETPQRRSIGRLVVPALALIAAAGWGAYVYESSRPFGELTSPADIAAPTDRDATRAPSPAATPEAVAPTDEKGPTPPAHQRQDRETRAAQPAEPPATKTPSPPATKTVDEAQRATPVVAAPRAAEPVAAKPQVEAPADAHAATASRIAIADNALTGTWALATRVEASSYTRFKGLRLGYRIALEQNGSHITGKGHKISENGQPLAAAGKTPITVEGTLEGDRVQLTFTEHGRQRASAGRFDLQISDAGLIRGRFISDAARSAGTAELRRTSPR